MTGKEQENGGRVIYRRHSPWFEATNWLLGCLQLYTKREHAFPNIRWVPAVEVAQTGLYSMVHISGQLAAEAESSRMRAGSSGRAETDDMARVTTTMELMNMFDKREREKEKEYCWLCSLSVWRWQDEKCFCSGCCWRRKAWKRRQFLTVFMRFLSVLDHDLGMISSRMYPNQSEFTLPSAQGHDLNIRGFCVCVQPIPVFSKEKIVRYVRYYICHFPMYYVLVGELCKERLQHRKAFDVSFRMYLGSNVKEATDIWCIFFLDMVWKGTMTTKYPLRKKMAQRQRTSNNRPCTCSVLSTVLSVISFY